MERFSYHGFLQLKRVLIQALGVITILILNFSAILLIYGVMELITVDPAISFMNNPRVPLYGLAISFVIISWSVGGAFANFLPTVWTDEHGIAISTFLFLRIKIPWESVIEIIPVNLAMGTISTKYMLVTAHKITIFHRIYSWFYATNLKPGFLIHKDIDNYYALIQTIRNQKTRII